MFSTVRICWLIFIWRIEVLKEKYVTSSLKYIVLPLTILILLSFHSIYNRIVKLFHSAFVSYYTADVVHLCIYVLVWIDLGLCSFLIIMAVEKSESNILGFFLFSYSSTTLCLICKEERMPSLNNFNKNKRNVAYLGSWRAYACCHFKIKPLESVIDLLSLGYCWNMVEQHGWASFHSYNENIWLLYNCFCEHIPKILWS